MQCPHKTSHTSYLYFILYNYIFLQVLTGNSDTASVVEHRLLPPIFASKVRLFPHSLHRRTVCLRAELLGCMDDGK